MALDITQINLLIQQGETGALRQHIAQGDIDCGDYLRKTGDYGLIFIKMMSPKEKTKEIIRIWAENGAGNSFDEKGEGLLQYSFISDNSTPLLDYLLSVVPDADAQIDRPNQDGDTMLIKAAREQAPARLINQLVCLGADTKVRDRRGKTARDYIRMGQMGGKHENILQIFDSAEHLPPQPEDYRQITRARLLDDSNGPCLLDAGRTWLHTEEILQSLEARGEWLTRDDLMKVSLSGMERFATAARLGKGPRLLHHLNRQNSVLTAEDLVYENGAPTLLLKAFASSDTLPELFSRANWIRQSEGLRKVCHALDGEAAKSLAVVTLLNISHTSTRGR